MTLFMMRLIRRYFKRYQFRQRPDLPQQDSQNGLCSYLCFAVLVFYWWLCGFNRWRYESDSRVIAYIARCSWNETFSAREQSPIKLGDSALSQRVVDAVWGFFSAYALVFVVCMLAVIATGMDELSAFSAVAATLNNLGPGLGEFLSTLLIVNDSAKWVLIVSMLFGRLEIFTLLILLTPTFWRS